MNIIALSAQLRSFPDLLLKHHKQGIESANDGLQAVEKFNNKLQAVKNSNHTLKPYQFIFMDYNMPNCDGPTAVKKIQESLKKFVEKENVLLSDYKPLIIMYSGETGL